MWQPAVVNCDTIHLDNGKHMTLALQSFVTDLRNRSGTVFEAYFPELVYSVSKPLP